MPNLKLLCKIIKTYDVCIMKKYTLLERGSDHAIIFLAKEKCQNYWINLLEGQAWRFSGYSVRDSPEIIFYGKRNTYISFL